MSDAEDFDFQPVVRKPVLSWEEFEYTLCNDCLNKFYDQDSSIGEDELCPTCHATIMLKEDKSMIEWLRSNKIKVD